jgi:hypothetical protein
MIIKPKNDGIDHINVYSKGKTELGRLLSNFAQTPFTHPKHGKFESVEGFWYFKKCGSVFSEFKGVYGYQAKQLGRRLMPTSEEEEIIITDEFKESILEAIRLKLRQNPYIVKIMIDTDLQFVHYYVNGEQKQNTSGSEWIIEELERIRAVSKNWYKKKYSN